MRISATENVPASQSRAARTGSRCVNRTPSQPSRLFAASELESPENFKNDQGTVTISMELSAPNTHCRAWAWPCGSVGIATYKLLIIDELGYVPFSQTGAELLFEVFSRRYERGSTIVTSNLPFDEWTGVFASERLTGALLDRLTHHVHILEMNGDSYRLKQSKRRSRNAPDDASQT